MTSRRVAIISLGTNASGHWGDPLKTLNQAVAELHSCCGKITDISQCYVTKPIGGVRQNDFLNIVLVMRTQYAPFSLLRYFKRLERSAGRRTGTGKRWGPRPLDIDIIDHGGKVNGWTSRSSSRRPGRMPTGIVLPHPQAHLRAFVLVPLLEIVPSWWHPALRQPGKRLIRRLPARDVASVLDRELGSCDK